MGRLLLFAVTNLDIFAKSVILNIQGCYRQTSSSPSEYGKEVTAIVLGLGGYFFLLHLDFCTTGAYTIDTRVLPANGHAPLSITKRSNRWFATPGGYFFLLQTLITRLITLTRRIQNWNNSEYVTIAVSPLPLCQGATKRGVAPC